MLLGWKRRDATVVALQHKKRGRFRPLFDEGALHFMNCQRIVQFAISSNFRTALHITAWKASSSEM